MTGLAVEPPDAPQLSFDYASLEPSVREVAVATAARIRRHGRRAVESVVAIGTELAEVKQALGHGHYRAWLEAEFGWRERQAQNFVAAARWAKSANFADLDAIDVSALYLVAAKSTPEAVRTEVARRATAGERVTRSTVRGLLDGERKRVRAAAPEPAPGDPPPERASDADPDERRPDRLSAALGERRHDLEPLTEHAPAVVVEAVDPVQRGRHDQEARPLATRPLGFASTAEEEEAAEPDDTAFIRARLKDARRLVERYPDFTSGQVADLVAAEEREAVLWDATSLSNWLDGFTRRLRRLP
jgi:Protein of unknown function (DUF3102)